MLDFITIKEVKLSIGDWCKALRKDEKISQQVLAEELGISRFTLANLENGENPTLDTLLKVLQYFDELKNLNRFIQEKTDSLSKPTSLY
ncbi:MAG: helix-turn-helix transcriptional regulator [Crocinitomicaceae bacterium]